MSALLIKNDDIIVELTDKHAVVTMKATGEEAKYRLNEELGITTVHDSRAAEFYAKYAQYMKDEDDMLVFMSIIPAQEFVNQLR